MSYAVRKDGQGWRTVNGPEDVTEDEVYSETQPAITAGFYGSNLAALWQAAHDYEYNQISGSAIGLLTEGALAGKPKALAVQGWIHSIWALYYSRKTGLTDLAPINPSLLDYSSCGAMPYSVPDLMTEMGY